MTELDTIRGDLRHGLRSLARARGFTSTVLLILALAVGASTALFSVLDGVLLRPLPVRDEADVVLIEKLLPADGSPVPFQQADVLAFAERSRTLEDAGGSAVRRRVSITRSATGIARSPSQPPVSRASSSVTPVLGGGSSRRTRCRLRSLCS